MNGPRDCEFTPHTAEAIAKALREAKVVVDSAGIDVLHRDDRFAAMLPDGRMAWFPANAVGRSRLDREAAILRLIAARCVFAVPTVDYAAATGWQLRRPVRGLCDPVATYRRVQADAGFAAALGNDIGQLLAAQHAVNIDSGLRALLPSTPSWPLPRVQIERDLRQVINDAALIRRAVAIIERYERAPQTIDPVLLHADLGFHNMIVDMSSGTIVGIFDYDDAAFGDRHHDFKYLLLDVQAEKLLESAIAAYRASGGLPIDVKQVRLFNAASAVGFLAYRAGYRPDERPAGRTLSEDLAWVELAMSRAEAR